MSDRCYDNGEMTISEIYRKFVLYFGLSAPLTRRYWHAISQTSPDSQCRTSLLPIESSGFISDLSGAYNNDYSKELDEYHLQRNRARQNIQRHRTNNRRSSSFDLVPPNLSICSKEYTEKKVHPRHRPVRLLPPSDVRLNHILPEDLNSTILTGHQIVNPAKDSNVRGFAKESPVALEKNNRTLSLASTSSLEQQYLQHQCQQLQLQQRHQQQSQRHLAVDNAEESGSNSSTKFQMPVLSKKFMARTSMPSMSSSMPSLKVIQKQPVEPHYADPMVNCPLSFHQRVAELILLESDTIRWEKSKKTKKKARDNS